VGSAVGAKCWIGMGSTCAGSSCSGSSVVGVGVSVGCAVRSSQVNWLCIQDSRIPLEVLSTFLPRGSEKLACVYEVVGRSAPAAANAPGTCGISSTPGVSSCEACREGVPDDGSVVWLAPDGCL